VLDYIYTDQEARAVAVHSAGILEALRKVYAADRLVENSLGRNEHATPALRIPMIA